MSGEINEKLIIKHWEDFGFHKSLRPFFGGEGELDKHKIKLLKYSLGHPHYKSGVWMLSVTVRNRTFPVILKVMHKGRAGNEIEINMYRKTNKTLQGVIPDVYCTYSEGDYVWTLLEHVRSIDDQVEFHPKYFLKIVPALADLHSRTFNKWDNDLYKSWLPFYHSDALKRERKQLVGKTLQAMDEGMQHEKLKAVLKPYYHMMQKILKKGPVYFPEVIKAGQCITHNDLQIRNTGCNDLKKSRWNVKFLDWESAKYYPCWFDMVSLIGVLFGYRQDFRKIEKKFTRQSVLYYAHEMEKHGVKFKKDPMDLYKMAYLQRALEYDVYFHISKFFSRNEITLLPVFLEKIKYWGKELRLY